MAVVLIPTIVVLINNQRYIIRKSDFDPKKHILDVPVTFKDIAKEIDAGMQVAFRSVTDMLAPEVMGVIANASIDTLEKIETEETQNKARLGVLNAIKKRRACLI